MFRFRFSARQSNAKRTRRIRIGTLPARAAASAGSSPPLPETGIGTLRARIQNINRKKTIYVFPNR